MRLDTRPFAIAAGAMTAGTARRWAMLSTLLLIACGGGDGGVSSPTPTTTELLSVQPAGGSTGVPVTGPMTLGFSGPMAAGMEQYIDLHRGTAADPLVPITCTWSADRRTASCLPAQPLSPNTAYTLHVGGGMMDGSDHPVDLQTHMGANGGQWYMPGMMGGTHAGMPMNGMAANWRGSNGDYGMLFPFTTG